MAKGAPGCCKPYSLKHLKPSKQKGVQQITDGHRVMGQALNPQFNWTSATHICSSCRLKLLKDYKNLLILQAGRQLLHQAAVVRQPASPDNQNVAQLQAPSNVQPGPSSAPSAPPLIDRNAGESDTTRSLYPRLNTQGISTNLTGATGSDNQGGLQDHKTFVTPTGSSASDPTHSEASGSKESETSDPIVAQVDLNRTLELVHVSPAVPSDRNKPYVLKRKYKKAKEIIKRPFRKFSKGNVDPSPQECRGNNCPYCQRLFRSLCSKYKSLKKKSERYKCLTSIPNRFTIEEIMNGTGCSMYMAREASRLRNEHGAFYEPPLRIGRSLPAETVNTVISFYLSDENSRASPNQRDVVTVKDTAGKTTQQAKRRIIHNLNDLYNLFKKRYKNMNVSVAKFASLRPKNCIWPGRHRHHVVCVCEIHQNFLFMLEALDSKLSVSQFLERYVCDINDENCLLSLCDNCPKNEAITDLFKILEDEEEVSYLQWVHTDATDIKKLTVSVEDFKNSFLICLPKIMEHDFINRRQTAYHQRLRNSVLKEEAAITVQVDFAQNYSFIVQNAVQSFHWTTKQSTVHPFVTHWWDAEEKQLRYKTYCVISDELTHDADTFHVFRSKVIPLIKKDFESIGLQKIYYISDGAGGQYKNMKNFANLMRHKEDYDLEAEWSFTATSHGKSTCDAISAVVKCSTRRESLKPGAYITTPLEMFNFCSRALTKPSMAFVYVSKEDVEAERNFLRDRYKTYKKLEGTRKHHLFQPRSESVIRMVRASNSSAFVDVDFKTGENVPFSQSTARIGNFYAIYEAGTYHAGLLVDIDEEQCDASFQLMKIDNRRTGECSWPEPLYFIDVAFRDILLEIDDPTTDDNLSYTIPKEALNAVRSALRKHKTKS